jgi:hypothetical protein
MKRTVVVTWAVLYLAAATARADFSYEQSSKITGGFLAGMMKFAGVFSKKATEPVKTSVQVKGDRMVNITAENSQVIDLGKETITDINFKNKTYAVITFAQMAEAMQRMMEKAKQEQGAENVDANFKISVTPTGQTRQINGLDTKEVILKFEIESKDKKSGEQGSLTTTSDMWLAPKVSGYEEVTSFHQRMGQKIAWTPGGMALAQGRSDIAKMMGNVSKETAKLDGIPVLQIMRMGGEGQGQPAQAGQPAQPAQPAPQAAPADQQEEGGTKAVAGALGRLGGFGGFGRRKKKTEEQPPQQQPEQQQQQAAGQPGAPAGGLLLETTTELTGFSAAPVDPSRFDVPAGFKQVEHEMVKALKK